MTVFVINQLNQSVQLEDVNIPVLVNQLVGYLLTRNVLVVVFLIHHVVIGFLSDAFDQCRVTKHVWLEIIFTRYFVQIIYSLVEFVDSDVQI